MSMAPSMMSTASGSALGLVKKQDYGRVHLSMHYKAPKNNIQVVVIAARLNKAPGSSGLPNPYAKLYMFPDPSKKTKQKTKAQKNTLDPVFNESFDFPFDGRDADDRKWAISLSFSVCAGVFVLTLLSSFPSPRVGSRSPSGTTSQWGKTCFTGKPWFASRRYLPTKP